MPIMRRWTGAAGALALAATQALAQGSEVVFGPGLFYIEGVRAFCGDIETAVRGNVPDLIVAPNPFTIVLDGPDFARLTPGVQLFLYFHTCGQIFYRGDVIQADAWAADQGISGRWLSAVDIETVCTPGFGTQVGWSKAPDEARCQVIFAIMRAALR